ncbi:globin domain-containing protein [Microbacterium sp. ASV49]|uniref:nitric oxide dioxygenase n=1 Tax=Microbacterium candidum TaxID=3041922 RepID=A0ABT7MVB2_9MICO|nr:globin domain-containing protein [Microbacterium sp. ASV49]MDL9978358.1 globin domain-containing protein [Microbacterium sp. ASV49]
MDTDALKRSWAQVAAHGDAVPGYFYAHLFLAHPEARDLFPVTMATQRDRLVKALGHMVSNVDHVGDVVPYIQDLGRDHRKFGTVAAHYPMVGASLLATLKHFLGDTWTPELASDWAEAYNLIATTMITAAEEVESEPATWAGEVVATERRGMDVGTLTVRPDAQYAYRAGQSLALEVPQRPRQWRYLSPTHAPRPDGTVTFHVQLVAGGQVSGAILRDVKAGDRVRLGPPIGELLTLPADRAWPDLLLVGGGTGLAPLLAVLDQVAERHRTTGSGPRVALYHGVRHPWGFYAKPELEKHRDAAWLTTRFAVSDDPSYPGPRGLVGDLAAADGPWDDYAAMVCGSPGMVDHTTAALQRSGIPADRILCEKYEDPFTQQASEARAQAGARDVIQPSVGLGIS